MFFQLVRKYRFFLLILVILSIFLGYAYLHDPPQCSDSKELNIEEPVRGVPIENLLLNCDLLKVKYEDFPELHDVVSELEFYLILRGDRSNVFAAKTIIDRNRVILSVIDKEIQNLATNGIDFSNSYPWSAGDPDRTLGRILPILNSFWMLHLCEIYNLNIDKTHPSSFSVFSQFLDKYMSGRGVLTLDLSNVVFLKGKIFRCYRQRHQDDSWDAGSGDSYWRTIKANLKTAIWNDRFLFQHYKILFLKDDFLFKENETWCQYIHFLKTAIEAIDSDDFSEFERLYREIESSGETWFNFIDPNKNGKILLRGLIFDVKQLYERMRKMCFYDPTDESWNSPCHFQNQ